MRSIFNSVAVLIVDAAPACQRWQAVRAVEFYRDFVLRRSEPDLSQMVMILARLGRQERNTDLEAAPTPKELAKLRGNLNRSEPPFIQTMRVYRGLTAPAEVLPTLRA